MKVTFNTGELQNRLSQLSGVVAKKATLEVFKYVRLFTQAAQEGGPLAVKLFGMDIDATLTVTLTKATAEGPVNVLLPFGTLNQIVSVLAAETTTIDVQPTGATLSAGRLRNAALETYPLESLPDTPERPSVAKAAIGLPGFQAQIENVKFAVPDTSGKFTVNVAKLESTADALRLIATDGFRLVICSVPQSAGEFSLILPKTALEKIGRLQGGTQGTLTIAEVEAAFWFFTETEELTVNRTAGEFPPYERIVPREGSATSTIILASTKELISLIHQTIPLADLEKPVLLFAAQPGAPGTLAVEAASRKQATAQAGELRLVAQADMDAQANAPADFSLDAKQLLPFLERVQDNPLVINFTNNTSVVEFNGANGQVKYLQVPTNPATRS